MACAFVAVAGLSSCLGDDEDTTISPDIHRQYGTEMTGSYSGMVRFYKPKTNNNANSVVKYDSLQTSWRVSADSTVSINYFPVNALDSAIHVSATDKGTDATKYRELQKAISNITPTTLKGTYYIPSTTYVTSSIIGFFVAPQVIQQTLTYNGETHTVYFVFISNSTYSYGEFSRSSRTFQFNMVLYGIYEDELTTTKAISSTYFNNIYISCLTK